MQAISPNEELLAWYEKNPMKKRPVKKKAKKSGTLHFDLGFYFTSIQFNHNTIWTHSD